MHHRIGLLVIVITSTYPVPTPQPKIRMGLFFYVKILENSSVFRFHVHLSNIDKFLHFLGKKGHPHLKINNPQAQVTKANGLIAPGLQTTKSKCCKSSLKTMLIPKMTI